MPLLERTEAELLFELLATGDEPAVTLDDGPATVNHDPYAIESTDGGASRPFGAVVVEVPVTPSRIPCIWCLQPFKKGEHTILAAWPSEVRDGLMEVHAHCAAQLNSTGQPSMTPGDQLFRGRTRHPDCARCGEPFTVGHLHQREYSGDAVRGWTVTTTHECADGGEYVPKAAEAA